MSLLHRADSASDRLGNCNNLSSSVPVMTIFIQPWIDVRSIEDIIGGSYITPFSRSVINKDPSIQTALSGRCPASGCECLTPLSGPGSGSRCQNSGSECQSQLRPGQGSQAPEPEPVGASLPIRQYAETGEVRPVTTSQHHVTDIRQWTSTNNFAIKD